MSIIGLPHVHAMALSEDGNPIPAQPATRHAGELKGIGNEDSPPARRGQAPEARAYPNERALRGMQRQSPGLGLLSKYGASRYKKCGKVKAVRCQCKEKITT